MKTNVIMKNLLLASIILMFSMRIVAQDCAATASPPVLTTVQSTCTSSNASIRVTSPLPGVGISYNLKSGGELLEANTSGLFEYLEPGTYQVTVTKGGCTDSPFAQGIINTRPPKPTLVINQPATVTGSAT